MALRPIAPSVLPVLGLRGCACAPGALSACVWGGPFRPDAHMVGGLPEGWRGPASCWVQGCGPHVRRHGAGLAAVSDVWMCCGGLKEGGALCCSCLEARQHLGVCWLEVGAILLGDWTQGAFCPMAAPRHALWLWVHRDCGSMPPKPVAFRCILRHSCAALQQLAGRAYNQGVASPRRTECRPLRPGGGGRKGLLVGASIWGGGF